MIRSAWRTAARKPGEISISLAFCLRRAFMHSETPFPTQLPLSQPYSTAISMQSGGLRACHLQVFIRPMKNLWRKILLFDMSLRPFRNSSRGGAAVAAAVSKFKKRGGWKWSPSAGVLSFHSSSQEVVLHILNALAALTPSQRDNERCDTSRLRAALSASDSLRSPCAHPQGPGNWFFYFFYFCSFILISKSQNHHLAQRDKAGVSPGQRRLTQSPLRLTYAASGDWFSPLHFSLTTTQLHPLFLPLF